MIDTVRHNHHYESQYPASEGNTGFSPAISRRDGNEPAHPLPEPDLNPHIQQAHDADYITMGCVDGPFGAVIHTAHAALATV